MAVVARERCGTDRTIGHVDSGAGFMKAAPCIFLLRYVRTNPMGWSGYGEQLFPM